LHTDGTWEFFKDEDGCWRWRFRNSVSLEVTQSQKRYDFLVDCARDAIERGYIPEREPTEITKDPRGLHKHGHCD
jgi:hypothetical protein